VYLNASLLFETADQTQTSGRVGFYANQGLARVKSIVVTGRAGRPAAKLPPLVPKYVKVCQDGGSGGYEAFPDVCRLADGRLMCAFYAGHGHVSLPDERYPRGGRLVFCTSNDEGKTWGPAQPLYDGPGDDRDPSITQLADGRILCTFFSLHGRKPNGEYDCPGTMLTISDDAGVTWSEPVLIAPDYYLLPAHSTAAWCHWPAGRSRPLRRAISIHGLSGVDRMRMAWLRSKCTATKSSAVVTWTMKPQASTPWPAGSTRKSA